MSIQVSCGCSKKYRVSDAVAGRRARCNRCGEIIRVPGRAADALSDVRESGDYTPTGSPLRVANRPSKKAWADMNVTLIGGLVACAAVLLLVIMIGAKAMSSAATWESPAPERIVAEQDVPVMVVPKETNRETSAVPPGPPPVKSDPLPVTIATNVRGATIVVLDDESRVEVETIVLQDDQLEHTFQWDGKQGRSYEVRLGGIAQHGTLTAAGRLDLAFDAEQIVELCRRATCLIKLPEGGHGSGFLYRDRRTVVTAAHVLATKRVEEVELIFDPDGAESMHRGAQLIHFNAETDVAILHLPSPLADDRPFLWPAAGIPAVGGAPPHPWAGMVSPMDVRVMAIGSPRDGDSYEALFTRETIIVAQRPDEFVLGVELNPGYSGGPVCLKDNGHVVGLISYKLSAPGQYEIDGKTYAKMVATVNDAFCHWDRMCPDAKQRALDRQSQKFARRYGYRCALKASYYLGMDSLVYTVCWLEFTADLVNHMRDAEREIRAKYEPLRVRATKISQHRIIDQKIETERQDEIAKYMKHRAPKKASDIRDRVTPRLLGNADKWYAEAMADETLDRAMKDQLKVTHECYTHLKTRAEKMDTDEGASNTRVEDSIEELKDYASRALTHAIEANQQALRGLQ